MLDKKYLSIGEFSKISGLSIKSIRYYDKIGILVPNYIDPISKYRYYSRGQLKLTNIIMLSLFLDIPLSIVKNNFIKDNDFNYDEFLTYSTNQVNKRIKTLKYGLDVINQINQQKNIQQNSTYDSYIKIHKDKINILVSPFDGSINSIEYDKAIANLLDPYSYDTFSYLYGIIKIKDENIINSYVFSVLEKNIKPKKKEHKIITIPSQDFLFKLSSSPYLENEEFTSILIIHDLVDNITINPTYQIIKN